MHLLVDYLLIIAAISSQSVGKCLDLVLNRLLMVWIVDQINFLISESLFNVSTFSGLNFFTLNGLQMILIFQATAQSRLACLTYSIHTLDLLSRHSIALRIVLNLVTFITANSQ